MKSHAPTSAERELARLAADHYELPESDIPALIAFERHKNEAVKVLCMPGLSAIPCFIAGYNAGRAAMQTAEPVAWMCPNDPDVASAFKWSKAGCNCGAKCLPLYAGPDRAPSIAPGEYCTLCDGAGSLDAAGSICPHCNRSGKEPSIDSAADACTWRLADAESGTWESSCGEAWTFIDGGPKENRVRFCHGCGKATAIAALQPEGAA